MKFGLVGKKLKHSFSQAYFTNKFRQSGLPHTYENYEIPDISQVKLIFSDPEIKGLNVTIPYKQDVIPFLDELDATAKNTGAVNCILINNGKKTGYNTDVFGFSQSIKPFFESHHEKALILGTGGASKAVYAVLSELGVQCFFASRHPQKVNECLYEDINQQMVNSCLIIVNTTPLGMFPDVDSHPPFPFEYLTPRHLVIDLIYNPEQTTFLSRAKAQGAVVLNGLTMLHQQAEKSWDIWNQ